MATIKIKKNTGADGGTLEARDDVFDVEVNEQCVRVAVNHYRAGQRAGTHSTKTKTDVRGGGRKPWAQKGTGRARQGSIRSVQWRGGSIAFGPHPRDYSYRINRKVNRKAILSALSELVRTDRLFVINDFGLTEPKTKKLVEILSSVGAAGPVLIMTRGVDRNVALSARNLPLVKCFTVDNPNIYDLLTHDYLIASEDAIRHLEEVYA